MYSHANEPNQGNTPQYTGTSDSECTRRNEQTEPKHLLNTLLSNTRSLIRALMRHTNFHTHVKQQAKYTF